VSVGTELALRSLGGAARSTADIRALVVGAGAMSSLAATTLHRAGVESIIVVNRTPDRAERLASSVGGRSASPEQFADELADADLLVSCTGAVGTVVSADAVRAAMRGRSDRPLFVLDLALTRDFDADNRAISGVTVVDLEALRSVLEDAELADDVEAARRIVTDEVGTFLARLRSERVAPTVVALRARAQEVVDAELNRLRSRLPALDERASREVEATVARVVDKLLHAPTVRIKELAESVPGDSYADVVRDLFALDPAATEVVTRADVIVADEDGAT
jgi:glutamyl-tRNA reductase